MASNVVSFTQQGTCGTVFYVKKAFNLSMLRLIARIAYMSLLRHRNTLFVVVLIFFAIRFELRNASVLPGAMSLGLAVRCCLALAIVGYLFHLVLQHANDRSEVFWHSIRWHLRAHFFSPFVMHGGIPPPLPPAPPRKAIDTAVRCKYS